MTYWLILYYAGAVVMTMGFEGQTLAQCEELAKLVQHDITVTYLEDPASMEATMFPTNQFTVDCNTERKPIDENMMLN